MRFGLWAVLGAVMVSAGVARGAEPVDLLSAESARVYTNAAGKTLNYRLYAPKRSWLGRSVPVPLLLFLHGAGERGSDNQAQLKHGVADMLAYREKSGHSFILLAPQCPQDKKWVNVKWSDPSHALPSEPSEEMALVIELLKKTIKELSVDASRVYVTGLSMGGFGTWDIVSREPELFAAAMPICGGGDTQQAEVIRGVPIRTFHGDKDSAVPVERSRTMVEALKRWKGNIQYTEFPGATHDVWTPVYKDVAIMDWLFEQQK